MLRPTGFRSLLAVTLLSLFAFVSVKADTTPALKYDKSSEVKIKGVVDDVKTAADNTIHITLKCEKGSLDVLVAPQNFLKEMEITFAKGDEVEVLGSQLTVDGNALLLVREVTRNGDVMMMRDEHGKPVWTGWIK